MAKKRTTIHPGIKRAIAELGSQVALARVLGVEPPTVNQWFKCVRPVPAERCVEIEHATGVSRRDLRKDWQALWPELVTHD